MGKTIVKFAGGMQFIGQGESGHAVLMDSDPRVGGEDTALRPVETMLCALGGCTGMDVISILRKMRTVPTEFRIEIEDARATEHPKVLTKVHLIYRFKGNVPKENADKAIRLSMERYCPITNIINKVAEVTWESVVEPD
ncbi:OsmC family peroxiredoxin [Candidatus Acetothermia bacterium]|jgi:putative redox protein|nr:OsmC family protein [Candidatus Bipolaricaulota bacterium]RLE40189.1 MAG: OsmC family peroxiredoxin [Candidatus Acetothermia bacterium]